MTREELRKNSVSNLNVKSSGYAWIPKKLFYSSPKVIEIIHKIKKLIR